MYFADNLPKKIVNLSGRINVGMANMKIRISPKYNVPTEGAEKNLDIAGQWIGPAGGLAGDIALGLYQLHNEDYSEGTETLINTVPGRSLWFLKGYFSELKRHVRNNF